MKDPDVKGFEISGQDSTDDEVIRKVIDAQARIEALRRENRALKKDRDELLSEYTDFRNARPVKPFQPVRKQRVKEDRLRMSFGDMHGMRMERPAVDALLNDIRRLQPDEIVMLGDMLECGGWLAKHHTIGYVARCDYSYQEDIKAGNWFLDEVQKAAPGAVLYWFEGNHDDRVEKWIVDETLSNQRDADFLTKPYGWLQLGKMYYTHELTGGKTAAMRAVAKTAANVTFGHTHQCAMAAMTLPMQGIVKAFNPGCLCELQPMWRHSDPTNWNHGYNLEVIAKSDNFQHIHVPIQDGESLGCALLDRRS